MKSGCPSTRVAAAPFARPDALANMRTRRLRLSATHSRPDESTWRPEGSLKAVAETPGSESVKLACPITASAAAPLTRAFQSENLSTRCENSNETNTAPLVGSIAIPLGYSIPVAVARALPAVSKSAAPSTRSAAGRGGNCAKAGENGSHRAASERRIVFMRGGKTEGFFPIIAPASAILTKNRRKEPGPRVATINSLHHPDRSPRSVAGQLAREPVLL